MHVSSLTPARSAPRGVLTVDAFGRERRESHLYSALAGIESRVDHPGGALLFAEGDRADSVYGIAEGVAMTYKLLPDGRRQVTGFLFPGDLLGLTFDGCHVCSAETVTACSLRRYPRSRLERLLEESPALERQLLRKASHELLAAHGQLLLLGRKSAEERLASFLCQLAERQRARGEPDNPVWLPVNLTQVADYLGLTSETVSRITTRLRSLGLISRSKAHYVRIEDEDALSDMAEGLA